MNLDTIGVSTIEQKLAHLTEQNEKLQELIISSSLSSADLPIPEEQIAVMLGVCVRTVRNRLKNREMDYAEIKGKRYVYRSEFDRYMRAHLIPKKNIYRS